MLSTLKRHRTFAVVSAVMLALAVFFICVNYNTYISVSKDRRNSLMKDNTSFTADNAQNLLSDASNVITTTAFNVEYLLNSGISDDDLSRYLSEETSYLHESPEISGSDIFGYFHGQLIYSAGAVSQNYSNAPASVWYNTIKNNNGKFTVVTPDKNSGDRMIYAGKLLSNRHDMLILAIPLTSFQAAIQSGSDLECILIDTNSRIIAHSDSSLLLSDFSDYYGAAFPEEDNSEIIYNGHQAFHFKDIMCGWRVITSDNMDDIYKGAFLLQVRHVFIFLLLYAAFLTLYALACSRSRKNDQNAPKNASDIMAELIVQNSSFIGKFVYFIYVICIVCLVLNPGSSNIPLALKITALAVAAIMAIPTFKKGVPIQLQAFMLTTAMLGFTFIIGIMQHNMLNIQDMLLAAICIISMYQFIPLNLYAAGIITFAYAYYWFYDKNLLMGTLYDNNSFSVKIASLYIGMLFIIILITWNKKAVAAKEQKAVEAQNADKAKSTFLANMSHEIRTPLNAICGMSEIVLQNERLDSETQDCAQTIHSSAINLLGVINDILDFSKIESGNMSIVPAPYRVDRAIHDVVKIIQLRIGEKPVELRVEIDPEMPSELIGDEMRLRQILVNLLNNAAKFTDEGHILLKVIWETEDDDNGILKVWVLDTGIGIAKEDMPNLFTSFSRFNPQHNHNIEGTGLGLSICKNLLTLMDGSIHVNSILGKGSTFSFYLPQGIADKTPCDASRGTKPEGQHFKTPFICPDARALIVDDNSLNIKVASYMLAEYKIRLDSAPSGAVAVERAKNAHYDIIFMDHMMPGMNGIEATKIIRGIKLNNCENVPIIALTANAINGNDKEFIECGMNDFLAKPIELEKLSEIMTKWIPDNLKEEAPLSGAYSSTRKKCSFTLEHANTDEGMRRCMNDEDMYLDILKTFAVNNSCDELERLYFKKDYGGYSIVVHGVKSALKNIGASKLSATAFELEKAALNNNSHIVESYHDLFMKEYKETISEINSKISPPSAPSQLSGRLDGISEKELVLRLKTSLNHMNYSASLEICQCLLNKEKSLLDKADLEEIHNDILNYDFDEAEKQLGKYDKLTEKKI